MSSPEQHTDRPLREEHDRDERGLGQRLKDAVLGEPGPDEGRVRDDRRDDPARAGGAGSTWGAATTTGEPARDTGLLDDGRRADQVPDQARDRVGDDPDRRGWGDRTDDRDATTDRDAALDRGTVADRDTVRDRDTLGRDTTDDRDSGLDRVPDQDTALDHDGRAARDREAQLDREATSVGGGGGETGERERLVPAERAHEYSSRWDALKGDFVDEPRQAMAKADQLVDDLLDEIQELFRHQRRDLEQGLDRDQASTEDLRLALRRYRSFFDRLLSF